MIVLVEVSFPWGEVVYLDLEGYCNLPLAVLLEVSQTKLVRMEWKH